VIALSTEHVQSVIGHGDYSARLGNSRAGAPRRGDCSDTGRSSCISSNWDGTGAGALFVPVGRGIYAKGSVGEGLASLNEALAIQISIKNLLRRRK
jgi:hypothetical protein